MEIPEFAQNSFFLQNTEKYSKNCDRSQKRWVGLTQDDHGDVNDDEDEEVVEDRSRWNQFLVFASRSHRQSRLIRVILFLCPRHKFSFEESERFKSDAVWRILKNIS